MIVRDFAASRRVNPGGILYGGHKARRSLIALPAPVQPRRGFTLLEMLLATLISALLMGAVYVAFGLQIRQAQIGRDIIEESTLAHSLLARMTSDIKKCVTPIA